MPSSLRSFRFDLRQRVSTAISSFSSNNRKLKTIPTELSGLEALPEDIHYLIFVELIRTAAHSLHALAQTSKILRQSAFPLLYRDITLTRGPKRSKKRKTYKTILAAFRVKGPSLVAQYVRNISVTDVIPSQDVLIILNKITECGMLKDLQ